MSNHDSIYGEIREQHQKTKDMSLKGKWTYFWDYYKIPTFAAIAVVALIITIVRQYVTHKDYAFYAALINTEITYVQDNTWSEEFAEYAGIDTNQYEAYIDTSYELAPNDISQYTIAGTQKLLALIYSGTIDVIVADTATFEGYAGNEIFTDLTTLLPEDLLEKYKDCLYYTDAASFDSDDDAYDPSEELPDPDTFVINHRDPSSMKQPIPVGICLPQETKIMASGCYDYLSIGNITYQGYPSEAVYGIPRSSKNIDTAIRFLEYIYTE